MKKSKAYVLLSGGLDSIMAVRVLQDQGIEVVGVCFTSNFYGCSKAEEAAKNLKIELEIIDISKEILALVKNPPHGLGKNMNPCIDCHSLMIKVLAKKIKNEKNSFIATGEVLGQRPFSQNSRALKEVAIASKYDVLRPLSAKLLAETQAEATGLVDREKLLDIQGRTRKRQIELVKKYKIKKYPSSGGGCMLTEVDFGKILKELVTKWPDCDINDAEIIKSGRMFWIDFKGQWVLLQIGRNKEDNEKLLLYKKKGDIIIDFIDQVGPIGILRSIENLEIKNNNLKLKIPKYLNIDEVKTVKKETVEDLLEFAGTLLGWFAPKLRGEIINLELIKVN